MGTWTLSQRCRSRRLRSSQFREMICAGCLVAGAAALSASWAAADNAFYLNDAELDRVTAAGTSDATAVATALGDPSLSTTSTTSSVSGDVAVDTTESLANATAAGDDQVLTIVTASSLSDDSGTGTVDAIATGYASGEDSFASSTASTRSISSPGADVVIGTAQSTASGSETQDAFAWVEPSGDIAVSNGTMTTTPVMTKAQAVGVGVSVNAR
jgi:hypothetical protein